MDILYQIRARQDSFSAGEGRIARLMLDDVGFAASASLEDLAQRAEVSTATLSRFARTVGCRDLRDLRLQLAQASGVGSRFLDPAGTPEQSAFYGQIVGDIETTLRQHLAGFDESRFADAVILDVRMLHDSPAEIERDSNTRYLAPYRKLFERLGVEFTWTGFHRQLLFVLPAVGIATCFSAGIEPTTR